MTFFKYIISFLFLYNPYILFPKDADCELVDYQVICTCDENKLVREVSWLLQINNRMGDKYAKVSIPYSKKMKLTFLGAQLETEQGVVIRELKKSEITDRSAISDYSLFEDDYIKEFELRDNFYPYRIRYSYRHTFDEFLEIINWSPVHNEKIPTRNARLEINTPVSYSIKSYSKGITDVTIDTIENSVKHIFEISNLTLPEKEIYSLPFERKTPVVRVVPEKFSWLYNGSHESWKEYGNWIFELIRGTDELPEAEKLKVLSLIKGKTSKRDVIKTLYRHLQDNTRYVNVSIDVGGLKPYHADYVTQKKYGDCKALSIYMKAMLKTAGITSYYTTIYSGNDYPSFIPDFPCHQSNHIILFVPLDNDSIFLECTSNSIPMGYIGTSTQGREAFIIDENNSHIVKTPVLSISDVQETKKMFFELNDENFCNFSLSATYKGFNYDVFDFVHTDLNHQETDDFIRERYIHLPSFELLQWDLSKPYRDSAFIQLSAALKLQNFLKKYGTEFGLPLINLSLPTFEQPGKRKLPLFFDYPINQVDSMIFKFPPLLKIKTIPEEIKITSKFGEYKFNPTLTDGKLLVRREFILYRGEYDLNEYQEFYTFITNVIKQDKRLIILTKN